MYFRSEVISLRGGYKYRSVGLYFNHSQILTFKTYSILSYSKNDKDGQRCSQEVRQSGRISSGHVCQHAVQSVRRSALHCERLWEDARKEKETSCCCCFPLAGIPLKMQYRCATIPLPSMYLLVLLAWRRPVYKLTYSSSSWCTTTFLQSSPAMFHRSLYTIVLSNCLLPLEGAQITLCSENTLPSAVIKLRCVCKRKRLVVCVQ